MMTGWKLVFHILLTILGAIPLANGNVDIGPIILLFILFIDVFYFIGLVYGLGASPDALR